VGVFQNEFTVSSRSRGNWDNLNEELMKGKIKRQNGFKVGRLAKFGKHWQEIKKQPAIFMAGCFIIFLRQFS
jgi:hypothetical protein